MNMRLSISRKLTRTLVLPLYEYTKVFMEVMSSISLQNSDQVLVRPFYIASLIPRYVCPSLSHNKFFMTNSIDLELKYPVL
jgi:hypothetical protein